MATITDNDLKMFQERAKTEFASRCNVGGIAWDSVIWDLCNEVRRLRSASEERDEYAKLREALDELVANIEMRSSSFDIFSIVDRKAFLDAKAALAATEKKGDAK